eukprot:gnl/MRDRNA2_/MRDRNA2_85288_c0_seq1.p1 gnl/MRDRNA2_/MRDRNA2_85288_c0~~gnl/MRDRNA2_/MRDRNA2_85288_c0_seq1.p1  ORF type:complete len:286 (+),score=64.94 gnl/MRDRNA2_/MRDRNA2_85288_c0_seq1:94-951(+)
MGAKLLFVALLITASNAQQDCSADKNNGFELSECGNGDTKICCHPAQQVCLSGTPKGGDEQFECSTNRALYGMKVVTVLIIPICACIFLLAAFFIMVKQVRAQSPKPPLALLCLCQTLLSVLVVFSMWWKFALYSAFIAVIVFHMMKVKSNKWVLLAIFVLQIFNLLATIGAYGTSGTFVPLGLLSADNVKSWEAGAIDTAMGLPSGCSAYYGNFFNVENVELQNEGADPLVKFSGYCSDGWLVTIAATIAVKAVFQLFMLMLSLQMLGTQLGGGEQKMELKEVM